MNKTWLIVQREYVSRVRKRSFLITTILVPIIIIGFYAAIIAISISDSSEKNRIAVIDNAGLFNGRVDKAEGDKSDYFLISGETETSFAQKYKSQGYDFFLYVPSMAVDKKPDSAIRLHSESSVGIGTNGKIEKTVNSAIEKKRLQTAHISPDEYKAISSDISLENRLDKGKENKKGVAGLAYAISFACGLLIYMILIIYGTMVMRGVMEEKINRIAEVLVSSVKPFQLMLGKIIGIGAVGLTQFAIWIVLILLLQFVIPVIFPALTHQVADHAAAGAAAGGNVNMISQVTEGLRSIPVGLILFCFIFYFLGGYLMYASFFAAIGSVISEDQQEAQQLVFPVMMPIILGFVIMTKAIAQPNSAIAVFGSLFPLTSPVVMMGRLMYDVPVTQLITSMVLLVAGFLFFTWLTAKIYRTGILLYGKKVTWKEMIRWAFRKS